MDFVMVHKVSLASRWVGEGRPAVFRTKVAPYVDQVWSLTQLYSFSFISKDHCKKVLLVHSIKVCICSYVMVSVDIRA